MGCQGSHLVHASGSSQPSTAPSCAHFSNPQIPKPRQSATVLPGLCVGSESVHAAAEDVPVAATKTHCALASSSCCNIGTRCAVEVGHWHGCRSSSCQSSSSTACCLGPCTCKYNTQWLPRFDRVRGCGAMCSPLALWHIGAVCVIFSFPTWRPGHNRQPLAFAMHRSKGSDDTPPPLTHMVTPLLCHALDL
jgi:hypothetical protein